MTGHQIKMIALDLDGTLLNEKKELLPFTRQIIDRVIARGVIVLIATGRTLGAIPEELRCYKGMRYALTANGARVLDLQEDRCLFKNLLPVEKAIKALETLQKYDTLQEVYFDGEGYADQEKLDNLERYHRNPHMCNYVLQSRTGVPDIMKLAKQRNQDMDKVQGLFANPEERERAWKELEAQEGIVLAGSLGYNIEVNRVGVSKGVALIELARLLGIKQEEIMACGDGDNDIEMLKEVGLGVAMSNAEEMVKSVADYITLSNEEEGAAKAIEKFALGGGELC